MFSTARALLSAAPVATAVEGLERLDLGSESTYWLRFLNGRWLIYSRERVIGDFPTENAARALDFLRLKQSELAAHA